MRFDEWAAQDAAWVPPVVRGQPIDGVVSWNLHESCNYRCPYCTQRRSKLRDRLMPDPARRVRVFSGLRGRWEFKLSGGEPFQQPQLPDIAAALVEMGHLVSVQTNLSAGPQMLEDFASATLGALHVFSASLHLDHTSLDAFLARCHAALALFDGEVRFNVTSVAVPRRLRQLHDEVAPRMAAEGIAFKVQPEKVSGRVRHYTAEERAMLLALGGHNLTGRIENDFQGRLCHAGARYLVVKADGRAWRCYPASRLGGRYAALGTLGEGVALLPGPRLCPYPSCHCTVPIRSGMIEGVPASPGD